MCPLDALRGKNYNLFGNVRLAATAASSIENTILLCRKARKELQRGLDERGLHEQCANPNKNRMFGAFLYLQVNTLRGILGTPSRVARTSPTSRM